MPNISLVGRAGTLYACIAYIMTLRPLAFVLTGLVAACSAAAPQEGSTDDDATNSRVKDKVAAAVADIPSKPPTAKHYRIHMIDVGSGLAILVQGADFTMLFDGGSGDDARGLTASSNKSRLLAYLHAALGPSGESACQPDGDTWPDSAGKKIAIDHVFLSHPHDDHVAALDEVLHCYDVKNLWEPGQGYDNQAYGAMLKAAAETPNLAYHTALPVPGNRSQDVNGEKITMPAGVKWTSFKAEDTATLGVGAHFKILHADTQSYPQNANMNSLVVRVDLGSTSLLLTGDAMAGAPSQPLDATPSLAEGDLLQNHAAEIDVDILQVGHHGSQTSTRSAFLKQVSPAWAMLSAGPKPYSGSVLPDATVVAMLEKAVPHLLRTDASDKAGCATKDRVGVDDSSPGGCDNHILDIAP